jgi:hypothetical protein
MTDNQATDPWAATDEFLAKITAWDEEAAVRRFRELDTMAAYYRANPDVMICAVRRLDVQQLAMFAMLVLMSSEETTAKILALVEPPDSIY